MELESDFFNHFAITVEDMNASLGAVIDGRDYQKPICICVTDQAFMANLSGGGPGNCVPVVRIEGGTLEELADMVCERFEGVVVPPGSVILLGSASHLYTAGATIYALDWTKVVADLGKRMGGGASGSTNHSAAGKLDRGIGGILCAVNLLVQRCL